MEQQYEGSLPLHGEIGISMHRLDADYSFLWANTTFYQMFKKEKQETLVSLRQLYGETSSIFHELHTFIEDARKQNNRFFSYDATICVQGQDHRFHMQGEFMNDTAQHASTLVLQYTFYEEAVQRKRLHDNFEWMMSEYAGNVYISDMDTYELLYMNQQACDTVQMSKEQWKGRKCYDVIQGRTSPCPFCTNAKLRYDETYRWEFYNPNLQRTFIIKNRMLDWYGHRSRIELSYDMYSAEYKLAKKDQEREAILNTIPVGMVRIDARDKNTILWHNGIFLDMIGYTEAQLEEELHNTCSYVYQEDLQRIRPLLDTLETENKNITIETKAYTREKEERIWTVSLCYVDGKDSWDGIPSYYSIGLDITDERRQIETLQSKAEKDALTDVYNRAGIQTKIQQYLEHSPRSSSALFMIDLDNFKAINDTFGHITGDVVLNELAAAMKQIHPESTSIGRIGGDEFVVFMKDITTLEDAKENADALLHAFHTTFAQKAEAMHVTCSIGIAIYPQHGHDFHTLYASADKALYQAKTYGKNRYQLYDENYLQKGTASLTPSFKTEIDSEQYAESFDHLALYAFRELYQSTHFETTVERILEIAGKRYDARRAFIFMHTEDQDDLQLKFVWDKTKKRADKNHNLRIAIKEIENYRQFFQPNGILYCQDVQKLTPPLAAHYVHQGVSELLHCLIQTGTEIKGCIGFDNYKKERPWTKEEVDTLTLIVQMVATFIQQKEYEVKSKRTRP